ncbi:MAG: DUF4399 domain-containing protein [Woeseiaceae bacterium]
MPVIHNTTVLVALAVSLAACGEKAAEKPVGGESAEAASSAEAITETAAEIVALKRTASPAGARVFFITPADGDVVSNPIAIEFGIEGMTVTKAGDNQAHSGHHHLLIDTGLPELGLPIPANANYVHFGDGSTATEISLEPGTHTLRMLLGDYRHIPHDPPVASDSITITVE